MDIKDMRILVVEDSTETINLIKNMLGELSVDQIFCARNGKEALDFLGMCDDMIDLVLCDWKMPKMTGIDLLKQLRTVDPELPFLMITGVADMNSVVEAKSHGVTAYIVKPFSRNQLEKKLGLVARMLTFRSDAA